MIFWLFYAVERELHLTETNSFFKISLWRIYQIFSIFKVLKVRKKKIIKKNFSGLQDINHKSEEMFKAKE